MVLVLVDLNGVCVNWGLQKSRTIRKLALCVLGGGVGEGQTDSHRGSVLNLDS